MTLRPARPAGAAPPLPVPVSSLPHLGPPCSCLLIILGQVYKRLAGARGTKSCVAHRPWAALAEGYGGRLCTHHPTIPPTSHASHRRRTRARFKQLKTGALVRGKQQPHPTGTRHHGTTGYAKDSKEPGRAKCVTGVRKMLGKMGGRSRVKRRSGAVQDAAKT